MKNVISEVLDYPNMMPEEIVRSDLALSGDALAKFMDECVGERDESYIEDLRESLSDVIKALEAVKADLE
tara:strand:+ start:2243 stop:2452 length:210 start_codon:yes stop_codon:yes gene_type:complete